MNAAYWVMCSYREIGVFANHQLIGCASPSRAAFGDAVNLLLQKAEF